MLLAPIVLLGLIALGAHLCAPWALSHRTGPTGSADPTEVPKGTQEAQRTWAVLGTLLMALTGLAALFPLLAVPRTISGSTQFRGLGLLQLPPAALALGVVLAALTMADLFGLMTWRKLARAEYRVLIAFGLLAVLVAGYAWNDLALRPPTDENATTTLSNSELVVHSEAPKGPAPSLSAARTAALLPAALASGGLALALMWPGKQPSTSDKLLGFAAAAGVLIWFVLLPAYLRDSLIAQLDVLTFVSAAALYGLASFLPGRVSHLGLLAATAFAALALTRASQLLSSLAT